METVPWPERTQNQASGIQPSNSTMQNYSSFQCVKTGGWFNGNPSINGSLAQPAVPSISTSGAVYYLPNGQFNGNYWNGKAPDLTSARNSDSFGAQKNGKRIGDTVPQLLLRGQALMGGNSNCTTPSVQYLPQSQYATQNTPLTENVPYPAPDQMTMANRANPQITHTTTENNNYYNSQDQLQFSGFSSGAHTTGAQGHGNFRANQQSQRTGLWQGITVTHYPISTAMNANPNSLEAMASMEQGLVSRGHGAGKASQRQRINGTGAAVALPAGEITNMGQMLTDRGNKISENPKSALFPHVSQNVSPSSLPGMNRNQGPVVNTPTASVYPPSGQSSPQSSWYAGVGANLSSPRNVTGHTQTYSELNTLKMALLSLIMKHQTNGIPGTGNGSGTVSVVPERTHDVQHRSSAPTGASLGSLNPLYSRANGNQNISQLGAVRSGSGNSSVQNVMEQQRYCHYPSSSSGVGNFAPTPSCAGNQGSPVSLTVQQPPGVEELVRRNVQEAECQTQSYNRNAQLSCFARALNGCAADGTRHTEPTQTMELAPNQIHASSVESHNGNPLHALSISSRHTPYFSKQAKQPHSQLRDDQPASDPPPYTVQQPPGAENRVRRNVQETEYQAQNGNAQRSCFSRALNGCAADGTRHTEPTQTMELAPNQIHVSSVESHNGNPLHALSISSRHTPYFSKQAKQPHSQLRDDQPASDPPPYTVQQPPGAENRVRRNVQETEYQAQNGNAQRSCFSSTLNKCVAVNTSHMRPTQTVERTPKQINVSTVESHNGNPAPALSTSSRHPSYFSNQAKQPHSQLQDDQPACDPPPYPQTHRYFVTVTEDRPRNGFNAENVILMDNQPDNHASALREKLQPSSTEKTATMDHRAVFGERSGSGNQKKHETHPTHSTAMISTAESVFNMPKPNNQQKCTGSSGQRAVAVVPPISQQSSNSIDQRSGILNADDGLPFKIQNTWSLTEDEYAAQQEMDIAVSVSLPHDMASDKVVHNVSTVSAPAMDIVSLPPTERTGSPFKKMAQTSDSVEPAISSTTGALDVNTSDPPDLEPQPITVTHQTEEMCGLHLNAYDSETSVEISGSGDKNGESEKNKFDLSSVPVVEWTTSKLNDLVSIIENKQKPLDLEIDIDKLIRVYGVCGYDNSDIFSSDDYISIMNDVSSVAAQDEHSVIFSQIKRKCLKKVKQNCQIIQHGDTFSDVVYKSSWLNLNEHLDDIDKEHGFPFHLRFKKRILEDYDSKELNESNCKPAEAPKEPEQMPVSPVLSQAGQQTSSDEGVRNSQDPLSSIKISVLTSEEARMFFNGEHTRDEKTEVLQSKLPELDSEEMESQMQVELPEQPFEEKENNQMKVYCCLARWISVITDHGKNIVCSCQSEVESDPEKGEASANPTDTEGTNYIDVVPFSSTVGGGCSMDVGNSFFVQKTGTADQQVKVKDMSDQCTGTENGSVVYQVQGTMHRTEEKNAEPPREQRPEMEQKNEDDLQTPPALPSGSTVVEVEIQGIYSNCKEVLKIASLMSKPLLSKGISKDECKNAPHANMDGNDHSYGAKGTGHVSLGYDEAEAKCLKFHQQGVKDLERQGFHKPLASNENHNHRDKNIRKRERKSKKCQWEIANPESKSSVCDYLPHSLKRRNKLEKPCHQVVCDIKATVEDYNDRTPLQEKREGHHRSESLKSESPELHEGKRLRNIQEGNGENGKMPRKENVFEVLPKLKEKACSVSLALYGSSPQKRNGTLRSHRELEGKPFKGRSCEERIPLPPTTISLMITPKKTDPFKNTLPGNGLAKQQVFASWKNSFVATKSSSRSKARGSTQKRIKGLGSCKYDGAAEIPGAPPTIQPNQPGPSAGQTSAHLFHRKVSPVKLRAVKKGKNKRSIPKSAVNEPFKPAAPKANKTTSAQTFYVERKPSDLTAGSLPLSKTMFLKKLKLKKKPQEMEPVHQWRQPSSVSSLPDAQTKSKCVNGNPALIPLQKEDNILEFKLLPESFSFKDGQDYKESGNPRQAKKTSSAKMSGKQSESLKKLTRKLQGSWSKSSEGKGISSEARSPSSTTRSGTTFQEYKKKYMAKDKK